MWQVLIAPTQRPDPKQAAMQKKKRPEKNTMPIPKPARGRPTGYTPENVEKLLDLIQEGKSTKKAAIAIGTTFQTVHRWLRQYPDFYDRYIDAKRICGIYYAEESVEIADDGTGDMIDTDKGQRVDYENVARSKLRVEARKWYSALLAPKELGNRVSVRHGIDADDPFARILANAAGTSIGPVIEDYRDVET